MSFLTSSPLRRLPRSIAASSRSIRYFSASRLLAQDLQFPLTDDAFAELKKSMTARRLPVLFEAPISTPTAQFETTLRDFISEPFKTPSGGRRWGREGAALQPIPFSYHLIYFPPQTSLSELLPDSTDPAQSPGNPFDRRMWAGGSIESFSHAGKGNAVSSVFTSGKLTPSGHPEQAACAERISDVQLKGQGDSQKIFVTLERRIGAVPDARDEDAARQCLLDNSNVAVIEKRNLVFMNNSKMPKPSSKPASPPKVLKAAQPAEYSSSLVPNAPLLFRFSALTFNAHRIHLDREYCRDVEGHRNLIVHGPLSCMLMCENLRAYLERQQPALVGGSASEIASASPAAEFISSLEYRNLAPIYADEEMRICLRKKDENDSGSAFEVWVENGDGSMCVKGTARTTKYSAVQ